MYSRIRQGMKLIWAVLILPCGLVAQEFQGFEINGHIDGLKDGEKIWLTHYYSFGGYKPSYVDSCIVTNGQFHLKGTMAEGPKEYVIRFDLTHPTSNGERKFCYLFIDNHEHISIYGSENIDKIDRPNIEDHLIIDGSPSSLAKQFLMPVYYTFCWNMKLIDKRIQAIQDSIGFDKSYVQGFMDSKAMIEWSLDYWLLNDRIRYVKPAIPYFLQLIHEQFNSFFHSYFLKKAYDSLDEYQRNSYYGKLLKDNAKLAIGQHFPEFSLPSPEGKLISIKDVVAKNRVTLVHFWGSNSYKREFYQKDLKAMYNKYHSKGLGVVGVSADSLANEWKTRVLVEAYPWVNVSDLKGNLKGGIVHDLYHEGGHSIPNTTNVLLDDKGTIIAWDVEGMELQWYLWKYLGE